MLLNSIASSTRIIARNSATRVCQRTFSAATAMNAKKQFILIARDYQDPDAPNRRATVRPKHLVGAKELKKSGMLQLGGALLTNHSESGQMIGSVMIFNADSEEEVIKAVERDLYVTEKVWEHYQIMPFRQAAFEP